MSEKVLAPLPTGRIAALVQNAPVAVLGYGISNRPLVTLLRRFGSHIHVYDKRSVEDLGEQAIEDASAGVRFYTDMDALPLPDMRVIFRSPGIHPDTPALAKAREQGVMISSEMAWFLEATPATVIAVTGSDGKTTTSHLTARMLQAGGKTVWLGGNVGTPLLCRATEMTADDFAVVELSSFQLYDLAPQLVPHRAAITNLSPNHLDWHADMEDYIKAKTRVYLGSRCCLLVTNAQNEITASLARAPRGAQRTVLFCSAPTSDAAPADTDTIRLIDGTVTYCPAQGAPVPIVRAEEIRLPGTHNVENIMTAIGLCFGLVSSEAMRQVARSFGGVEHRLELVRTLRGVTYYNSSIDSSPSRTAAALSALNQPIVAICGGYDKHIPFAPLAEALCARAKAVVLTGATAQKIAEAIESCPAYDPTKLTVCHAADFSGAVQTAAALAGPGDAVLLSPACASFDAFPNFMVRGEAFKRIVKELK